MPFNLESLMGISKEDMEMQEAMDNSFGGRPLVFIGDWDGTTSEEQDVNRKTGEVYPRVGFTFTNCEFVQVKPADIGKWQDGDSFTVTCRPDDPSDAKFYQKELGRTVQDSGDITQMAGCRIKLTEKAKKPWPTADRPVYYYKWEVVGESNGAKPATGITEDANVAALSFVAGGNYTEQTLKQAWMNSPQAGIFSDLSSAIALGHWQKAMLETGRLKKDAAGILST